MANNSNSSNTYHNFYVLGLSSMLIAIFTSVLLPHLNNNLLKTSVLEGINHSSFDGTVYPIKTVPDWVNLSSEKWDARFSALTDSELIEIPYYDPELLSTNVDNLEWGNPEHNKIRNSKITYSVPYMGNYLLDGNEYAGSHLAVDIKVPIGTPVYAISNGVVAKSVEQNSGFGYHIVIQHNNVPGLNDPNANTQLFSSYSHMSSVLVDEGMIVKKGQQIGLTGNSGTATTPHLHFQIDNSAAPWHPYWPFTWKEASDAGLDFFSAINAGLGSDKAKQTTINPMLYVQKYLDNDSITDTYINSEDSNFDGLSAGSYVDNLTESTLSNDEDEQDEHEVKDGDKYEDKHEDEDNSSSSTSTQTGGESAFGSEAVDQATKTADATVEADTEINTPPQLTPVISVNGSMFTSESNQFTLDLVDQYGNEFRDGFAGEALLTSVNGFIRISTPLLTYRNFDGKTSYKGTFSIKSTGRDRLKLELNGNTYYSDWFNVEKVDYPNPFKDLSNSYKYYDAILYLNNKGIVGGYTDATFRPNETVTRVEALKLILEGIKAGLGKGDLPFNDVDLNEWYSDYVYTAYDKGIVTGYPDGTFKPANTVNRSEFYKILFNGMGVDINPNVDSVPFDDVSVDDWFAPYVVYAYDLGIIDKDVSVLNPAEGMTRGEVAYAIYRLLTLKS